MSRYQGKLQSEGSFGAFFLNPKFPIPEYILQVILFLSACLSYCCIVFLGKKKKEKSYLQGIIMIEMVLSEAIFNTFVALSF